MSRTSLAIAGALTLLACSAPAHAQGLLEAIDQAARADRIAAADRQLLRAKAVLAPGLLAPPWRELARRTPLPRCATPILAEAFQSLRSMDAERGETLRDLLRVPDDLAYSVESLTPFPIRVTFGNQSEQSLAEQILADAEESFSREVTDWGFWAPPIEPGTDFYRIRIATMEPGVAGYTSPYLSNPDTSWSDAFTYIAIDPGLDDLTRQSTVAHELNHAMQIAMDVLEPTAFMENTASYIESEVFPESWPLTLFTFASFQSDPWRPLESMGGGNDYFPYGGALFVYWLDHTYGGGARTFLRRVWEESVQDGYPNEPDYFDAIDTLTTEGGGVVEVMRSFSEDRFFVGQSDDGQHLDGAADLEGAEVWVTDRLYASQLPAVDRGPESAQTEPQPNGCNYVVLELNETHDVPIRASFAGLSDVPWEVRVASVGTGIDTTLSDVPLDASHAGTLSVPVAGVDRLVLMICQRPDASYDPDARSWPAGDYRYGFELDVPPPTVTSVEPAQLEQGAHDVEIVVHGSGFVPSDELAVRASGTKVVLVLTSWTSDSELRARALATPDAELGPRDVIVTNPGGAEGIGSGLLTIMAPPTEEPTPQGDTSAEGSGCGCRVDGGAPGTRLPASAGLVLGLLLARRRGLVRRQSRRDCEPCRCESSS